MKKQNEKKPATKFQKWICGLLEGTNQTNIDFARQIGVHDSTIGHYVLGRKMPTYRVLCGIKKAVRGLDMNDLFD